MKQIEKQLSTTWKVALSMVALVVVTTFVFSGKNSVDTETSRGPISTEPPPGRNPDATYMFTSSQGAMPPATFSVGIWLPSADGPCKADIYSPSRSPRLRQLAERIQKGVVDDRRGLVAEVLSKCTNRFVYLDGGGEPGIVQEYFGSDAPTVAHNVRVLALSEDTLRLELHPGPTPDLTAEVARLEALAEDSRRAVEIASNTGSDPTEYERRSEMFKTEVAKLRAR